MPLHGLNTAAGAGTFTAEAIALQCAIPANRLKVGSTFRGLAVSRTSAGATTITARLRFGTLGTLADPLIITTSVLGGVTPPINMHWDELLMTARAIGASGSLAGTGWCVASGSSTTPLGNTQISAITPVTVNTTVANFLTITLQASTGTGTLELATLEAVKW